MIFDARLVRKQALLHYKKADFTQRLYWLFSKGVPYGGDHNWEITPWFVWDKNKPRNNI